MSQALAMCARQLQQREQIDSAYLDHKGTYQIEEAGEIPLDELSGTAKQSAFQGAFFG